MGERKIPRRRVEVDIHIGADDWEAVRRALSSIAFDLARKESGEAHMTSGAPDSGYTLRATDDPSVTHDSYFAEVHRIFGEDRDG